VWAREKRGSSRMLRIRRMVAIMREIMRAIMIIRTTTTSSSTITIIK
jgi:hypothetical protein